MIAYVGQGNSGPKTTKMWQCRDAGLGLCLCPGELPPLFAPWFLDNGAFRSWRAGTPWDADAFQAALDEARTLTPPDFVVAPDVVGGGLASLALSLSWLDRLEGFRAYLAVQDGMTVDDVRPVIGRFAGVFVGGTLEWKMATGSAWVDLARERGVKIHVGRVGVPRRVAWALAIGVDSVDSSAPLWTHRKLERWLGALSRRPSDQRPQWDAALRSTQGRLWP